MKTKQNLRLTNDQIYDLVLRYRELEGRSDFKSRREIDQIIVSVHDAICPIVYKLAIRSTFFNSAYRYKEEIKAFIAESILKAFKSVQKETCKTYIVVSAFNNIINHFTSDDHYIMQDNPKKRIPRKIISSLDIVLNEGENEVNIVDTIPCKSEYNRPQDFSIIVRPLLQKLPDRLEQILIMRSQNCSLQEIALVFKISRQRVEQLEKVGVKKIRQQLELQNTSYYDLVR